jgi:hypothetical protein
MLSPQPAAERWLPQLRMVPAQLMCGAVAMRADARAQLLHFGDEFVSGELGKIFVHSISYKAPEHCFGPAVNTSIALLGHGSGLRG